MDYVKNPEAIAAKSMDIISRYTAGLNLSPVEEQIVKRVIHTTGDPDIAGLISFGNNFVEAAQKILNRGDFIIYTDVQMVKAGINQARVTTLGGRVICRINEDEIIRQAGLTGETRAMTALQMSGHLIDRNIVVIGNAPTALFKVLEMAASGIKPGVVIGTPVGFVGAAESKEMLAGSDLPFVTVKGTRGGSTIAAAIVNALLYNQPV